MRIVGKGYQSLTDTVMDLARLKRELADVKMERDILVQATAYIARMLQPGMH